MIQLLDHFLISVPNIFSEGGDFKHLNAAHYIDQERDRYERKLRQGIVYSAPIGYRQINHNPIDPGIPNHKLFIGHDAINRMAQIGHDWGNEKYHPGTKEHFKYESTAAYGARITVEQGDEIYFHPSVTEPANYFAEDGDNLLYKAQVHELICSGVSPQGFWLLVEPIIKEKMVGDIALSIDDEDEERIGIVKYANSKSSLKTGEHVTFQEGCDWNFEVHGQRLYAMLEENILLHTANF